MIEVEKLREDAVILTTVLSQRLTLRECRLLAQRHDSLVQNKTHVAALEDSLELFRGALIRLAKDGQADAQQLIVDSGVAIRDYLSRQGWGNQELREAGVIAGSAVVAFLLYRYVLGNNFRWRLGVVWEPLNRALPLDRLPPAIDYALV